MRENLALVVGGTARINSPFAHDRFERGRGPEFVVTGGLDVIMSVDEHGGGRIGRAGVGEDGGMTGGGQDFGGQAGVGETLTDPLGRLGHVGQVVGLGRDRRHGQPVEQIIEVQVEVGVDAIDHGCHAHGFHSVICGSTVVPGTHAAG